MDSIPQVSEEVKACSIEECHEPVFRRGLCWDHFKEEVVQEWDAQDAEREICLQGMGHMFREEVYG